MRSDDSPEGGERFSVATRSVGRVLVIDDSADTADTLAEALRLLGYRVEVAYDGLAALARLHEFSPEVALIDIGLPGMDGYELARAILALTGSGKIRLIALTGYARESDRERSRDAGFDVHLVKPIGIELLSATIERRSSNGYQRLNVS